ncbi:MAG TPA: carboxypeptidase M32 [Planctomycetota bacterium]|nr:carboxypeptidase M32 [Planctomycetota bacterium]
MNETYSRLISSYKEIQTLAAVGGLLNWDQETYMPPKGAAARAEMIALTSGVAHDKLVAPEIGDLLGKLEGDGAGLGEGEKANVREIKRAYEREVKIPAEIVRELARTTSLAQEHWVKARKESRFDEFAPWLETIVGLKRKVCEAVGWPSGGEMYDAMLDEYEPGARAAELRPMFASLKAALVPLVQRIAASKRQPDASILTRSYPVERQKEFGLAVIRDMGFDLEAGRQDVSAHPFCSSFGPEDVRLTTRYNERDLRGALFGSMHEAGHGLYEQGLAPEHMFTPLGTAVSMGVHESQSRMWENLVGRSRPFWSHYYPKLQATFPEALGGVAQDAFYFAVNEVRPSLIRVEADEVTYNLHILLRFELEQELLAGKVAIGDLPAIWNKRMTEYLGIAPAKDGEGVLQDIHWSLGLMGYFPTYTLGNLYAAQLFAKAKKELGDLDARIGKGDLLPLRKWLREKIHRHGMRLRPADLMREVTGEAPTASYFTGYLEAKFGELYGL